MVIADEEDNKNDQLSSIKYKVDGKNRKEKKGRREGGRKVVRERERAKKSNHKVYKLSWTREMQ